MNISRESIFLSSLRSFFSAFFAVLGVGICLFLFVLMIFFLKPSSNLHTETVLQIEPDHMGQKALLSQTLPVIIKINLNGIIGDRNLTARDIETKLASIPKHYPDRSRIKGILLHIDTPGGTITDSFEIYRTLKAFKTRYKLPVYAYVDGTCASGGIYVTSATDKVHASPVSLIGSVGVVCSPALNVLDLLNKHGVKVRSISAGKDKTMLSPLSNWEKNSDESLVILADHLYDHFVNLVVSTRPKISREELVNKYGAKVFIASEAEKIGFIDNGDSSYSDTLLELVQAAGLHTDSKYQVISIESRRSILEEILGSPSTPSLPITRFLNSFGEKKSYPFQFLYKAH